MLAGGVFFTVERFGAYIAMGLEAGGFASKSGFVPTLGMLNTTLSDNQLVVPFLIIGSVLMAAGILLEIIIINQK
ncbi:hypothetical protein [Paenibacillus guangzhouensis]|uniref:hypothetical protein n=1 Tax=Paenibacillus guangzhouensis TaxID=1473112 RepID=UPI001266B537|nr:hypothetical protein [Paenibacillus guangzhouensis]